jgi:ribosomal protein L37AE/L43A
VTDQPQPKPRKYMQLWQAYLWWNELVELRKRHTLRISAVERGVSQMDAQFERDTLESMRADWAVEQTKKVMVGYGKMHPMWPWLTGIRGMGEGGLAAQLLAQIDDIASFTTVSKLWRFCGYAVIDGQIERGVKGEKSHYNRRLKSICWQIAQQFVRQQTSIYVDIYYDEKERQRRLYPESICKKCGAVGIQKGQNWVCSKCKASAKNGDLLYTPKHLQCRAERKMMKIFLQHLWLTWRQAENLPVTMPYVHDVMGHTHYVPVP